MMEAQRILKVITNTNWVVFGLVLLVIGLFVIYGAAGWAWLGFGLMYLFGITSMAVRGSKLIAEREEN